MKTIIITSQEYKANSPSVFASINGTYYGELTYPHLRGYPSADYWRTATSSDSDRGFSVKESKLTTQQFERVKELQLIYGNNIMQCRPFKGQYPVKTWTIKRGKKYEAYKVAVAEYETKAKEVSEQNAPFIKAYTEALEELTNILQKL